VKGRIAIFTSNRAEHGLLEPVIAELEKWSQFHPFWAQDKQHPDDLVSGMESAAIAHRMAKLDFGIVPCDRQEMVGVALYLFYHNIPFAQLHAGDTGSGVHDEIGRWIISRCASIHFCDSPQSVNNLLKSGEEDWRVFYVGSTAFDNVTLDESIVPKGPFNLVLVHPDTFSEYQTRTDIEDALWQIGKETLAVVIGPNHDKNWEIIHQAWIKRRDFGPPNINYVPSGFPRPQFLALMKHCTKFITNSSSALYELPFFDRGKWVNIGLRNANREQLRIIDVGASARIALIIRDLVLDDRLLRKQFVQERNIH
jgi:UDP-N-acetylglucosamine 2-epimerase